MDAGCSEACSNKRRVSNKRRSDRSALDAEGGGCQQHVKMSPVAYKISVLINAKGV